MTVVASNPSAPALLERYRSVRDTTARLAAPLTAEDCVIQSMPDASPTKWHLAHTTWFFETFVLAEYAENYAPFHPRFGYLFNSYYEALGPRHSRPKRGLLSRPGLDEVRAYRAHVDGAMEKLLSASRFETEPDLGALVDLGIHHEQQHQELALTDIKHAFAQNPLEPSYVRALAPSAVTILSELEYIAYEPGVCSVGHDGRGFAFDNEQPRHRVVVEPFSIASRLVTNGEYFAFIDAGGYERPDLWLSDGWATVQTEGWTAPLYYRRENGVWSSFTLGGRREADPTEPVCHVSFYEADAFARWAGARLPTEYEWENAASQVSIDGNFLESERFHPAAARTTRKGTPAQLFGDVWEWTASPYVAYPGYKAARGALGEYNGKFMCNQMVLRGGSCVTPRSHIRATYRNFFPPSARWQFTGIRLAQ